MKHTSFELAKQVYDKGVRIEDSEYRYYGDVLFQIDEVECILGKNDMSDDKLQTLLNFGDPIPSPTLCEWLEWLPSDIFIGSQWKMLFMRAVAAGVMSCGEFTKQ